MSVVQSKTVLRETEKRFDASPALYPSKYTLKAAPFSVKDVISEVVAVAVA